MKPNPGVDQSLAELGELAVLARLRAFCASAVGDDAYVQRLPSEKSLVVTTDVLVDGVHFSDRTMPPHALGWRAAAANLSDLAAMGATPLGITVAAALPPDTQWHWLEKVYQGMLACLRQYGGEILGGDLARSAVRSLAITALGTVPPSTAIYRHTAQLEQTIMVTGRHGAARAGLALLLGELDSQSLDADLCQDWIAAHQYPVPRLDAIAQLRVLTQAKGSKLAQVAGMDSSDGLANAVMQLCRASGVGAKLVRSKLPMPFGLSQIVGQAQAEDWTLYGGEDFELVMCLPPRMAEALVARLGGSSAVIGQTTAAPEVLLVEDLATGEGTPLDAAREFKHF
ncbi:MAG: thiamine-phosphate kinase [Cyanobacteria bacterium P01_D01_bin.44]